MQYRRNSGRTETGKENGDEGVIKTGNYQGLSSAKDLIKSVHLVCPSRLSITFVHHLCPIISSITFVYTIYQSFLSITFVHRVCSSCLSIMFVHHFCPLCLSIVCSFGFLVFRWEEGTTSLGELRTDLIGSRRRRKHHGGERPSGDGSLEKYLKNSKNS